MRVDKFVFPEFVSGSEIKSIRKSFNMTQKSFANFAGVSVPTVERWEAQEKVTGSIVPLIEILKRNKNLPEKLVIPEEKLKLRMFYMFESMVCTLIDIDETERIVKIKNYIDNPQYRAFGINTEPTFEDYEEFIESRCFPRTRDKMKLELQRLGIPFYDPILIVEKTGGRMAEDKFWIRIER